MNAGNRLQHLKHTGVLKARFLGSRAFGGASHCVPVVTGPWGISVEDIAMIKMSSVVTLIVLLLGVPPAWAQDPGEVAKLKARIDKLEAENAAIKRELAELKKTLAAIAAQARPGPEEEKKTIIGLYNRHCIRCHGLDGRGVWDIPKVPDFTDGRWQASRSDAAMLRTILEGGKGTPEKQRDSLKLPPPSKKTGVLHWAVMPSFRDILTREEASSMARFVRTFAPGTETPEDLKKKPLK